MSVRVMTWVWDMDLAATEKLVMLALADCANDEGTCWPSIATLCRKTGASERTIQRAIQSFAERGLLRRVEVPGKGCRYHFNPRQSDTPVTVAPVTHRREPPSQCHPTPVTVTPKPSMNHQEPSKDSPPAGEPTLSVSEIVEGWNDLATRCGLAKVAKLTDARKRKAAAQAKRYSVADWLTAFSGIERSAFLRGTNDRGWRADFDFILSDSSFVKILEGKYDPQPSH